MKYQREPQDQPTVQPLLQGLSQEDTEMVLCLVAWLKERKVQSRTARRENRLREFKAR
jgi:hypothetical protein